MANKESHNPDQAEYNGPKTLWTAIGSNKANNRQPHQNLAKRNIWTRGDWKDVKTAFSTELKRIAASKARINKGAKQHANDRAELRNEVKARSKRKGYSHKKQMLAEQADKFCKSAAELKEMWRATKRTSMTDNARYTY